MLAVVLFDLSSFAAATRDQRIHVNFTSTPINYQLYLTLIGGDVEIFDTATNTVVDTIAVGDTPRGVAIIPDGLRAYVLNGISDNISIVDTATDTVIATVPIGISPSGYADFLSVPSP